MFGLFKRAEDPEIEVVEEPEMIERRAAQRNDTYADVVAVSNNGRFLKRGIALDLSANGARLRFENGDSLLDGMVVKISRYGVKRRGKMRWRTKTDVGVEFINDDE